MKTARQTGPAEVDLAALLDAMNALAPGDDESRRAIAALLGFDWLGAPVTAGQVSTTPHRPSAPPREPSRFPKLPKPNPRSGRDRAHTPTLIEAAEPPVEAVTLFATAASSTSAVLGRTDPKTHLGRPEHVPLVAPGWARGVLTALLATHEPSSQIDWDEIERTLVKGAPLERMPWRSMPSLRRGAELWLDVSESMEPYRRDQVTLVRELRLLLGKQALRTFSYRYDPLQPRNTGLRWDRARPREATPGSSIVLVSDFGSGKSGGTGDAMLGALKPWLEQARDRQCRIRALIPAAPSVWPTGLSDWLVGFEWDRSLSARGVGARARPSRRSR